MAGFFNTHVLTPGRIILYDDISELPGLIENTA
jgi:hypothetical protein